VQSACIETLPNELLFAILRETVRGAKHLAVVCSFVCMLWRESVHAPSLFSEPRKTVSRDFFSFAAEAGHLSVLKWAHENGCPIDVAASGGRLEVLKWLRGTDGSMDLRACEMAALGGHLEALKEICADGCPWRGTTAHAHPVHRGHMQMLLWLRNNVDIQDMLYYIRTSRRQQCGELTCVAAASGGHLETLKWLRGSGCHWDENTCTRAALGGHLETLTWARENGCAWSPDYVHRAAMGYKPVVEWLRENGYP